MKIYPLKFKSMRFFLDWFWLIWAHNLGAQAGIPVSKILWIHDRSYVISIFAMKDIFVEQFIVLINPTLF